MRDWPRNERIAIYSLLIAIIGIVATLLTVPEFRRIIGLNPEAPQKQGEPSPSSEEKNAPITEDEQGHFSSIRGTWAGTMYQPGFEPFPVTMTLGEFKKNEKSGSYEHPTLRCGGILIGVDVQGGTYILNGQIEYGRDRCLDGLNRLTLENENILIRVWMRPDTGKEGARGSLKKIKAQ